MGIGLFGLRASLIHVLSIHKALATSKARDRPPAICPPMMTSVAEAAERSWTRNQSATCSALFSDLSIVTIGFQKPTATVSEDLGRTVYIGGDTQRKL